jgi:predicted PhzF superfamily epimerase YddE/YHI9
MKGTVFNIVDVFAQEKYAGNHIHARAFAAYLAKHRYFGAARIDVRVEQGYENGQ